MYLSRYIGVYTTSAAVLLASVTLAQNPNSTCLSFGVDFLNGGSYYINTNDNEDFTATSYFEGCNNGFADIWLVDPNGNEYECTDVPTFPDDTYQTTTCPISKTQITSGNWLLVIFGNNANGNPFAYQRNFSLTAAPQVTTTVTPTVTWNQTIFPVTTFNVTSTTEVTTTLNATRTITLPASTASCTETVKPKASTVYTTATRTRSRHTFTKSLSITTETETASCTVPPKNTETDPPCYYKPKHFQLPIPNHYGRLRRFVRRQDQPLGSPPVIPPMDVPTTTVTGPQANVTVTYTAAPSTVTESMVVTLTDTTVLPDSTVYAGIYVPTTTLPARTKTRTTRVYTTTTSTCTLSYTLTITTTVMPPESASACKHSGGHWGEGW